MKTLKFCSALVDLIHAGTKTKTWRLFDYKDLSEGDHVCFVVRETGESFAQAVLTCVVEKTMHELTDDDRLGHESYENEKCMYATLATYYGRPINTHTSVKVITFEIL